MTVGGGRVYASARDCGHDPRGCGHDGRGARLRRGKGGRADRRDPFVIGYARAKCLTGGSYTTARAEERARAHEARQGRPTWRRGRGRGETGVRSRAKWAERPR
jgi:hypothetical protein